MKFSHVNGSVPTEHASHGRLILDEHTLATARLGFLSIAAFITGAVTISIAPTGSSLILISGLLFAALVLSVMYYSLTLKAKPAQRNTARQPQPVSENPKPVASEPVIGLLSSYTAQPKNRDSRKYQPIELAD